MWHLNTEKPAVRASRSDQKLLAILPDIADRDAVGAFAIANHWGLNVVSSVEEAGSQLSEAPAPVILIDCDLPDEDWRLAIQTLISRAPCPCVILASAVVDLYLFNEVVHHGGYDVVSKPFRAEQLRRTLGLAFTFWENGLTRTPK
jgi:DNA-binding NtrC family response regulator